MGGCWLDYFMSPTGAVRWANQETYILFLIEENPSTLSPEIDMDASYFPLTGFLIGIFIVIILFLLNIIYQMCWGR